jgi:hypothetical protein
LFSSLLIKYSLAKGLDFFFSAYSELLIVSLTILTLSESSSSDSSPSNSSELDETIVTFFYSFTGGYSVLYALLNRTLTDSSLNSTFKLLR